MYYDLIPLILKLHSKGNRLNTFILMNSINYSFSIIIYSIITHCLLYAIQATMGIVFYSYAGDTLAT